MKNLVNAEQVAERLSSLQNFALVSHVDPDPDAYGSMLGLGLTLEARLGKSVSFVNQSGAIAQFGGFPGLDRVSNVLPELNTLDAVIVLDCGDLSRVGDSFRDILVPDNVEVINIDHHYANSGFGTCAFISAEASSTSEMVVQILECLKVVPTPQAALALYCGISGDTGSFQYSSTRAETFRIAATLVEAGAEPHEASRLMYGNMRKEAVQLQSYALGEMQFHCDGRLAEVFLTEDDFSRFSADPYDTDRLVERARDIEGVDVSVFIRQHGDLWKVSMRAKSEAHDVSKVAESFGGGGHRAAAAFRWKREVEDLHPVLLECLREVLGDES
jgi:phosphoesterase RecJ-like protein